MNIIASNKCEKLADILELALGNNPVANGMLSGCELSIGPATEGRFGVPAHARDAVFVGDSDWIEKGPVDAATEALLKTNPNQVAMRPQWDSSKGKWIMNFKKVAGDAVDFIGGQLFSPWNISYMSRVFKEPLSYSSVDKYVSYDSGSNPWAEIFTLYLEKYSGWAAAGQTGSLQNIMMSDVNVRDGMMSAPIINIMGTYSLTLEEEVRGSAGSPFGTSPMTRKQTYLNYAINMLKAVIAIYGNAETDTDGFLTVSPIIVSPPTDCIKNYVTQSQPGYKMYASLAAKINDFLTAADNKFTRFVIVMSPEALNYLRSSPYSEIYDPTAAIKIFLENYGAVTKEGKVPSVEFISEPLLKAQSIFNPTDADYTLILAPEIPAGPTEETQPTYVFGAPLQKFVFPAIPGQYNTQYKTLARLAGLITPTPGAIRCYQGYGVQ